MSVRVIQGHVRDVLPTLPPDYFDCIVTSPPYFGLRDYGTAKWEGGDDACDHKSPRQQRGNIPGTKQATNNRGEGGSDWIVCGKCGARRVDAQIGLEPALGAYLETMVAVCRELRRVLKSSGVFFLNVADSYQKDKCLCLMPQQLGILLKKDGWIVRSDIIWHKKNPMPESVTDRPTSAHETIWMLTKREQYFWDAEAVAEDADEKNSFNGSRGRKTFKTGANGDRNDGGRGAILGGGTRNVRNVWSVATSPTPFAHFATMPPEIAERCIKAGSSEKGCCPVCGRPWVRVVERGKSSWEDRKEAGCPSNSNMRGPQASRPQVENNKAGGLGWVASKKLIGWNPSCKCPASEPIPARILDPFAGSGTTGLVADRLGRDCTLIDLNTSYIDMAVDRIRDDAPLFVKVAAE